MTIGDNPPPGRSTRVDRAGGSCYIPVAFHVVSSIPSDGQPSTNTVDSKEGKGAVMTSSALRGRSRAGLTFAAATSAFCLGMGLGVDGPSVRPAHAARMTSRITANSAAGTNLAVLSSRAGASRAANSPQPPAALASAFKASSSGQKRSRDEFPTPAAIADRLTRSVTDPIAKSSFLNDLKTLFAFQSGKFVNWNEETLRRLGSDLGFDSGSAPNAAPRLPTPRPVYAAQVIEGDLTYTPLSGAGTGDGTGTVQAAPVPEPGAWVLFALALGGLAARSKRGTSRSR